jgi:hypothetical protein
VLQSQWFFIKCRLGELVMAGLAFVALCIAKKTVFNGMIRAMGQFTETSFPA